MTTPIGSKTYAPAFLSEKPRDIWVQKAKTPSKKQFFWSIVDRSFTAYENGQFIEFDAHTTSNCCHGVSTLARDLILSIKNNDVDVEKIKEIANQEIKEGTRSLDSVDTRVVNLACLYLLAFVGKAEPGKGRKTNYASLKSISNISYSFCEKISKAVQKCFSTIVAKSYQKYAAPIQNSFTTYETKVEDWSKYISGQYLRSDKRKTVYASCMYSMQVILAYLVKTQAKIVWANDLCNSSGELRNRIIKVLQPNSKGDLIYVNKEKLEIEKSYDALEPVVVFSGYSISDERIECILENTQFWSSRFKELVLACDQHYPQFPKVSNDPNFDSSPIVPKEASLKKAMENAKKTSGVSVKDPSFFMLSHIYPASLGQVMTNTNLPLATIYTPPSLFNSRSKKS